MSTIATLNRMLKRMKAGTLPAESDIAELEEALDRVKKGDSLAEALGIVRKVGRPKLDIWKYRLIAVEIEMQRWVHPKRTSIEKAVEAVVASGKFDQKFETLHNIYKEHRLYARWHVEEDGGPIIEERYRQLTHAFSEYLDDLAFEGYEERGEDEKPDPREEFKSR